MKVPSRVALLASLLLAPALAFAAPGGNWTGAHIGVLLGGNSASSDYTSTELAFVGELMVGYDFQPARHFVLGVDGFYQWNNDKSHNVDCPAGATCPNSVRYGSKVYGLTGRAGFPFGEGNAFMPYVKVGYGWYHMSGDLSYNDNSALYGVGFEWMSDSGTVSLLVEYTHQKLDVSDFGGSVKNDNISIGANFFF